MINLRKIIGIKLKITGQNIMFRQLIILFVLMISIGRYSHAQEQLANEYFKSGEYEKAAVIYNNVYKQSHNKYHFALYIKSLLYSDSYDDAIGALNTYLRKNPHEIDMMVWEAYAFEKAGKMGKAEEIYNKVLQKAGSSVYNVSSVANTFVEIGKYENAVKVYESGIPIAQNKSVYFHQIGYVYSLMGEVNKMTEYYIKSLIANQDEFQLSNIKNNFSRIFSNKDFQSLESILIKSIQENPDNLMLIDLLSWVYIQSGNYDKAFRQISAVDRRYGEDGRKVYYMAEDAKRADQSAMAAKAYKYIIDNKDVNSAYFLKSASNYLTIMSNLIKFDTTMTSDNLIELEQDYNKFIQIYGINDKATPLILGLAELKALYLNQIDEAIKMLEDFINRSNIGIESKAMAKLALGDYYLIKGEVWEASLLYSQVDKSFVEGELGEIARNKNGKLYYFDGDFEWSQIIFDILKPATSKMISNDAIETSVFITETMGEDSINVPLQMFSSAELLILQNKFDEAMSRLDSINFLFPENNLEDDIWFQKAEIFKKLKKFDLAKKMYEQIIEKFPTELKADNAIFELANLYEKVYHETEKAKQLYEKLFIDYPFSTLAIESRKKFRQLNGENAL
jgi:tetratricopeptide (TPR) repeat protein